MGFVSFLVFCFLFSFENISSSIMFEDCSLIDLHIKAKGSSCADLSIRLTLVSILPLPSCLLTQENSIPCLMCYDASYSTPSARIVLFLLVGTVFLRNISLLKISPQLPKNLTPIPRIND